jgi:hypothetical protein
MGSNNLDLLVRASEIWADGTGDLDILEQNVGVEV